MTDLEPIDILRYWVAQTSFAVQGAAYLRGFEHERLSYVQSKANGESLADPRYCPQARMALMCLWAVEDSLVLFCRRAVDSHEGSENVIELKNQILRSDCFSGNEQEITKVFRLFDKGFKQKVDRLKEARDKLIAHSEMAMILRDEVQYTPLQIVGGVDEVIKLVDCLVRHSGLKKDGDETMLIRHPDFAEFDAEDFWASNFALWAK